MSNYTRATLTDGSKVVLYSTGNQGWTRFYFVCEVISGPATVGASVARECGSTRYSYKEMV